MNKQMKIFFSLIISILLITACSEWSEDQDRFVNTYRDILAIRLMFPDTAVANPKIEKIYKRYGYTHDSFKSDFFKYAQDPETFRTMIDSARIRARRDYIKLDSLAKKKADTTNKN